MNATCWWTVEQVKRLQKSLGVADAGILNKPTWDALVAKLAIDQPKPKPEPQPVPGTAYKVKNHLLYKGSEQVSYKASPNRGGVIEPELIVIHYTGDNGTGGLNWLTQSGSGVSAHLWISKTGVVWQLLPFNIRGWHAGVSFWGGRSGVNDFSIGIENQGLGDEWPEKQIQANIDVIKALADAYDIQDLAGHDEIAEPAGRKSDPGKYFPWERVRKATGF